MSRKLRLYLLYIFVPLVIIYVALSQLTHYFFDALDPNQTQLVLIDATPPKTFKEIALDLQDKGIIRNTFALRFIAQSEGTDTMIKGGEYELSAAMTPRQILEKMVRGDMFHRRVTIKEGMNMTEIASAIEQAGVLPRATFEAALRDPQILRDEEIDATSFEGYLYPETYQFPRNTSPVKIIKSMREQLTKRWLPEWSQRAKILEMTTHQVLTLASIIEKESGNFEEQPVISSVFHNRLKKGMRLQADPTVIYGIANFDGNITKKDLSTPTPYNTYVINGLPPGPIASPGINAIRSTLYPTDTNFLYFVGNGSGRHIFSETLDQHVNAVNQYQKNRAPLIDPASSTDTIDQALDSAINPSNPAPPSEPIDAAAPPAQGIAQDGLGSNP